MGLKRVSFGDVVETRAVREAEGPVARAAFQFVLFFDGVVKFPNFCVALHSSSLRSRQATPHSSKFVRLELGNL